MGSGKSTIGSLLSEELDQLYIDTDSYIEEKQKQTIADIFKAEGEATFRTYETEALIEIEAPIISTGGGIIGKPENIEIMQRQGKVIYLKVSFDEVTKRLENDVSRPLWDQDVKGKEILFKKRAPIYEAAANLIIETDGRPVESIIGEIIEYVKE